MAAAQTTDLSLSTDKNVRTVTVLGQLAFAYLYYLRSNDSARAAAALNAFVIVFNSHAAEYAAYAISIGLTGGTWLAPTSLNQPVGAPFDRKVRETMALSVIFLLNLSRVSGSDTRLVPAMDAFPGPGTNFNQWFDQTFQPLIGSYSKENVAVFRTLETFTRTMDAAQVQSYLIQKASAYINNVGGPPVFSPKPQPQTNQPSTSITPTNNDHVIPLDVDNPLVVTGNVAKPPVPWGLIALAGVAVAGIVFLFATTRKKGSKHDVHEE